MYADVNEITKTDAKLFFQYLLQIGNAFLQYGRMYTVE